MTSKNSRRTKSIIHTIEITLGTLLALFLAFLAALLIYVDTHEAEITEMALQHVNASLEAEITVSSAEIEITRYFPDISLKLSGATLTSKGSPSMPSPIRAASLFIRLDLRSVLRQQPHIKSFSLENADIVLYRAKSGETNLNFLTNSKGKEPQAKGLPDLTIPSLHLKEVTISYLDKRTDFQITSRLREAKLHLTALHQVVTINLDLRAAATVPELRFSNTDVALQLKATYYSDQQRLTISSGELMLRETALTFSSEALHLKKGGSYQLNVAATQVSLQKLLPLMPEETQQKIHPYHPHGTLSLTGTLSGKFSPHEFPAFRVEAAVNLDTLSPLPNLHLTALHTDLQVAYNPQKPKDFMLEAKHLQIQTPNRSTLTGWLVLRDWNKLFVNTTLEGSVNFQDIAPFLAEEQLLQGEATLKLAHKGNLRRLIEEPLHEIQQSQSTLTLFQGNGTLHLGAAQPPLSFHLEESILTPQKATFKSIVFTDTENDLSISGVIKEPINLLQKKATNIEPTLQITSNHLDVEHLMQHFQKSDDHEDKSNNKVKLPNMKGVLSCTVSHLKYKALETEGVQLTLDIAPDEITLKRLKLTHGQGTLEAKAHLFDYTTETPRIKSTLSTQNIAVSSLFSLFNNFGSQTLTSDHLKGDLTADLYLTTTFTQHYKLDKSTLLADGNLMITNGALLNYAPLKKLAQFLRLDDLSNIQFDTLTNQIYIKDRTLHIPEMAIANNVMDLYGGGEQHFDGEIDYHLDLKINELLRKKYQKQHQENQFGVEQSNTTGGTHLYLKITGTTEEPTFRYDTPRARKALQKRIQREKEALSNLFPGHSTREETTPQESDGFQVAWEETDPPGTASTTSSVKEKKTKGKKFDLEWE
ncbi:MAG: hypothetical protein CSA95_05300 [Bacteroidetes bacterium]|nr:MAG: hypothetical protein CSA95_05300 [Bacteroidota bacterium]PIE88227.1 MAG: hypothetical protein CSA04_02910 [Bacteroidota bacterium]